MKAFKFLLPVLLLSLTFGSLASANEASLPEGRQGPRLPVIYIAEAFSMEVDELRTALIAGDSLEEIASDNGVSAEVLAEVQAHLEVRGEVQTPESFLLVKFLKNPANREILADLLGVSTEDLKASFEAGVSIGTYVEEHGWTMEDLLAKLKEIRKETGGDQDRPSRPDHPIRPNRDLDGDGILNVDEADTDGDGTKDDLDDDDDGDGILDTDETSA